MGKWEPEEGQCGSGSESNEEFYVQLGWKENARAMTVGPFQPH